MIRNISLLSIIILLTSSFSTIDKGQSEYFSLQKLEKQALRNTVGKIYLVDLTGKDGCYKTKIQFLGFAQTNKGKSYKILTSFFVFSVSSTCHGACNIKIFDMKNRYIGKYCVALPEDLPDVLKNNKLFYLKNSKGCNLRTTTSIDLYKGLPKSFFIACSKNGGDEYVFSNQY